MLAAAGISAQQIPLYNHSFFESYIANPADVGLANRSGVTLVNRRQRMGDETSMSTSLLTAQLPLPHKLAMGVLLVSDRQGMLANRSGMLTVGYHSQLGKQQQLRFAVSAGGLRRSIRQQQVNMTDPDDPTLLDDRYNGTGLAGNAGLSYQFDNLQVGFAISGLFDEKANWSASMSYRFGWPVLQLMPQIRMLPAFGHGVRTEGQCTVFLKEQLWLGMAYRQQSGAVYHGGCTISRTISVGYAYEQRTHHGVGGTHELLLNIRFGRREAH